MTVQPVTYAPPGQVPAAYQRTASRRAQGLSSLIHARSKAGKSCLANSGPTPSAILDVEGASYWTPKRKIYWDPQREPMPDPEDQHLTAGYGQPSITPAWESAIVLARDAASVFSFHQVLDSGRHPFKSLSVDSFTEVQQRVADDMASMKQLSRDQWGAMLRQLNSLARRFRDLVTHPVNPLWSVAFVCGSHYDQRMNKMRPMIQGQAQDYLPYYVDLLGYIEPQQDGTRYLLIGPHPNYETGERVGGRLPFTMQVGYPGRPGYTIEDMLLQVLTS